jgi:hypothetical protein
MHLSDEMIYELMQKNTYSDISRSIYSSDNKQTPWPLVRKWTIPTDDSHVLEKFLVPTFADRGVSRGQRGLSPTVVNLIF